MTDSKNNKINIRKESAALGKTFVISFVIALLITNNENWIFSILNSLGLTNEIFQKTVLSLTVTAGIGLIKLFLYGFSRFILNNLQPLEIKLILTNGKFAIEKPIEFYPIDSEYEEQQIDMIISFKPKGKLNMIIMKYFGIIIDIYFNPNILDIYFENGWESQNPSFEVVERSIKVNLLSQISIKGKKFFDREHVIQETILIKPIRVKNTETYLDYNFSSIKHGMLSRLFTQKIELDYKVVDIICKEG
ncbi:hypothetical protein [Enterococcus faecium]|uniref:hypothetical protein n=1 Tax=Enterococcus TaxID=1350 RepID=UPI000A32E6F5|nr:hypothetical protein [Enterococcus faecium]OTN78262.1 hypothetical protein A5826_002114 [Enterococcus faecium]